MKKIVHPIHKTSIIKFLFEQEEEAEAPAEEPAADDAGEDPFADEGGDDPPAAAGGDDAAGEDAGGAEGAGEGEEVEPGDSEKLGKAIDDDLEALLVDFETQARKSKQIEDEQVSESLGLGFLLEADYAEEIDIERFTSEVARLIKNYDTLLDMESLIMSKAKSFISSRYGETAVTDLEGSLADNHGIEIEEPPPPPENDFEAPVAVGAGTPAGGA